MSTIKERDAAREKSARVHAKHSDRLSALLAEREKSGRLMVSVDKLTPHRMRSQINAEGLCRHDMQANICSLCRTLESFKLSRSYITVAKKRLEHSSQEVSSVKDRGWQGVPSDIPIGLYPNRRVTVRRYKQLPVKQPARLPIGDETPESKPVLIAMRATSGGTRRSPKTSEERRVAEVLGGIVNRTARHMRSQPRLVAATEQHGAYCPWPRV